jgi:hypothetical protein
MTSYKLKQIFYIQFFYVFREQTKKTERSGLNGSVLRKFSFLLNQIMVCYCHSQISELCDIFERCFLAFYIMICPAYW